MVLLARPRKTFLFVQVLTADQALKLALGSAVMTLWVVFFAIAVLVSLFGIPTPPQAHSCISASMKDNAHTICQMHTHAKCDTGLYCKISVFFELRKRRAAEFGTEVGDAYTNKHQKKHDEAAKTIRLAYATVLAGVLEGKLHPPLSYAPICCC